MGATGVRVDEGAVPATLTGGVVRTTSFGRFNEYELLAGSLEA